MAKAKAGVKKAVPKKATGKKVGAKKSASRNLVGAVSIQSGSAVTVGATVVLEQIKRLLASIGMTIVGSGTDIRFGTVGFSISTSGTTTASIVHAGSGDWSVTATATGRFVISFTGPSGMPAVPAVSVTPLSPGVTPGLESLPTRASCVVLLVDTNSVATNAKFSFIAIAKV